ncbi:Xanthine phosphoribosyltransferase 1 [Cryptotrichosporon argae]
MSSAHASSLSLDPGPPSRPHMRRPSLDQRRRRDAESNVSLSLPPLPYRVRHLLSPRVAGLVLLWLAGLYALHRTLLPLPVPSLPRARQKASQADAYLLATAFPSPPRREGDDALPSRDPRYRPYRPLEPADAPFPRLRPTRLLPRKCMEEWFLNGETTCGARELGEEEKLDATWLWVNGSDPRWAAELAEYRTRDGVLSPERHFREQNELVYSMRSVLSALAGHIRTFHLITYDYAFRLPDDLALVPPQVLLDLDAALPVPPGRMAKTPYVPANTTAADASYARGPSLDGVPEISAELAQHLATHWRVAQTPNWLDFSRLDPADPSHPYHPALTHRSTDDDRGDEGADHAYAPRAAGYAHGSLAPKTKHDYPSFRYATHAEIFHLPTNDRDDVPANLGEHEWREREWRKKALPCFNSMSIEGRIGWLHGLADVSLALNDDFFIMKRLSVSDFHSPLYGNVFRFDHGYGQQVVPKLQQRYFSNAGELGGLYHACWLLSQRFPKRRRPYFAHAPKVITRSLHHEASLMFKEALTQSGQRRFRELAMGHGDVQMQWMLTALRVERWREALLWTYVVANLGGAKGYLDEDARGAIADMFGLTAADADVTTIEVYRGERYTLEPARLARTFAQAGWTKPKSTRYLWSSMDGHMPKILPDGTDPAENDKCLFHLDRCLGPFWARGEDVDADTMFKRLAFMEPECGDCLIMALVTTSGPLGLSAFFPPADAMFRNAPLDPAKKYPKYLAPPHLALTPTWHEANFSLPAVMARTALPDEEVELRWWSMKLLARYLYVDGQSDSHFHMLTDPQHAQRTFALLDSQPGVAILGLNDDIVRGYDIVRDLMGAWFGSRWPAKAVWERGWTKADAGDWVGEVDRD